MFDAYPVLSQGTEVPDRLPVFTCKRRGHTVTPQALSVVLVAIHVADTMLKFSPALKRCHQVNPEMDGPRPMLSTRYLAGKQGRNPAVPYGVGKEASARAGAARSLFK